VNRWILVYKTTDNRGAPIAPASDWR